MPEVKDETTPTGAWTFDKDVTDAFDDMLKRSIPQYEVMRESVFELGSKFVQDDTAIVDLGCSRGEALAPFVDRFGARNYFVGVDVSEPMLAAARERFSGLIKAGIVEIKNLDLRRTYPARKASLTLAVLTVQFVPIEYRQNVVSLAAAHTLPGGAFVFVEKVLGADAQLDALFVERYYAGKRANGYSQDAIDRKRLSLEGVLVPLTAQWNEEMLDRAGFSKIDCFWRWMNFAGWIAVK